jgi:hypothetical protein
MVLAYDHVGDASTAATSSPRSARVAEIDELWSREVEGITFPQIDVEPAIGLIGMIHQEIPALLPCVDAQRSPFDGRLLQGLDHWNMDCRWRRSVQRATTVDAGETSFLFVQTTRSSHGEQG